MIKDWWESFRSAFYDRTTSPLAGAFLLSWVVINFKFFIILFSDESLSLRLSLIDELLFPTGPLGLLRNFAAPIGSSLLFIFVYPIPSLYVYRFWLSRKKEMRDSRDSIEKATLLSFEEGEELRRRNYELQKQHREQIKELEAVITGLRGQLESRAAVNAAPAPTPTLSAATTRSPLTIDRINSILRSPLTGESLRAYSYYKFPDHEPSPQLETALLEDIRLAGLTDDLKTVEDLDNVVSKTSIAIGTYEKEKPNVFGYSTDYLTKALGFYFPAFRNVHGFNATTKNAFDKLAHLVQKEGRLTPDLPFAKNSKKYFLELVQPGLGRELLITLKTMTRAFERELFGGALTDEQKAVMASLEKNRLITISQRGHERVISLTSDGLRAAQTLAL